MSTFTEIKARAETLRDVKTADRIWELKGSVIFDHGIFPILKTCKDATDDDLALASVAPKAVADRAALVALVEELVESLLWAVEYIAADSELPIFMPKLRAALAKVQP